MADRWGWESTSTDWRAAMGRADIDAVDIALPNYLHAEAAIVASVSLASVDRAFHPPYAGLMNLQVPLELEAKLARLGSETGRTVEHVALELLVSSVDGDGCFRREVEKGRRAASESRLPGPDDVASGIDLR